jgi:hypothetical protein
MKSNTRRTVCGRFRTRELGSGAWQLTTGAAAGPEIYLTGTEPKASASLRGADASAVAFEWRDAGVLVTLTTARGAAALQARNAIIHEPLTNLYAGLPLASLDEAARRFWRRVFRLVRIPGGRYLLGLIARRSRGPK